MKILIILLLFCSFAYSEPLPLGAVVNYGPATNCPAGWHCNKATVVCAGLVNDNVMIADQPALNIEEGTILFHSGGGGTGWTSALDPAVQAMMDELRQNGYRVVQTRWASTQWFNSNTPGAPGMAYTACRPATLVKFIHDTYLGDGLFKVFGTSGGASAVAYPLSHYGLDEVIDVAVFAGGPVMSALAKSCQLNDCESNYYFDDAARQIVDRSWGFYQNSGPCVNYNPAYIGAWLDSAHSTGARDLEHPATDIYFLIGESDGIRYIAQDYYNVLTARNLAWELIPDTSHSILQYPNGRAATLEAMLP